MFPSLDFQDQKKVQTIYVLLKDLGDENFAAAIHKIGCETKEIFPGTNIAAMIRENAQKIKVEEYRKQLREEEEQKNKRMQLEAVPMPEESRKLMEHFNVKSAV